MKFPWHPDKISSKNPAKLRNFLEGEWVQTKNVQQVIDPLNEQTIILMPDTKEEELKPFVDSLANCPKYGLHNPLYYVERYRMYGDVCRNAAQFLRGKGGRDYFTKLINLVMPKGLEQCASEVDVVASFLETFSGNGVRNLGKGVTTPGNHAGEQPINYRWPYGPVAIITPFNFPLEIMALQLMGALFMGNKPILKQSSTTSIVAEAFVRLLLQCGMPKDDMLLIHCSGSVMEKVVTWGMPKPVVQLTQFTGSSEVAHRLSQLTNGRCRFEDAGFDWKLIGPLPNLVAYNEYHLLLDQIAKVCDRDAYAASGQKCSAQSIIFVRSVEYDYLAPKLKKLAAKRNLSDLSVGPVLTWDNRQIQEHVDKLLAMPGAELLFGGKPLVSNHSIPSCYGSYEPTAVYIPLSQILPHFKLVTMEIFGPVQVVTKWEKNNIHLVLSLFEKMENHLTAGVVSNDPEFLNYVLGRTINGTTYAGIRARTTGAPEWHFFGPAGHPAGAGIGTPEAIINTWSQNRTIIYDTREF